MYAQQNEKMWWRYFSDVPTPSININRYSRFHLSGGAALVVLAIASILAPWSRGFGQTFAGSGTTPMTLNQVVDRMVADNAERAKLLESYRGTRTYTLVYKGFPSRLYAQMVVNVRYTAPDHKEFSVVSRSGPKWMQDQVMMRLLKSEKDAQQGKNRKNVDLNTDNYTFSNLEYHAAPDHCSYRLTVQPKTPTKYLYRGNIWINDRAFAVCRIEAQPAKNPSFWIRSTNISHSYEQIGQFWLPHKNVSVSAIRIGGLATLSIRYENYQILSAKPAPSDPTALSEDEGAR
ncbi:MAG TPA: hypothetical protein VFN53_10375 [Acidobacteriaceae bacterium]|nr:hypothetical protein [Acidobacteriaceae bacterium]